VSSFENKEGATMASKTWMKKRQTGTFWPANGGIQYMQDGCGEVMYNDE
jgi:hypothetical protein